MATTCFFEETLTDKEDKSRKLDLEFGRSSYYDGESLIYIVAGEQTVILDDAKGRELYDAMMRLGAYLGYDK